MEDVRVHRQPRLRWAQRRGVLVKVDSVDPAKRPFHDSASGRVGGGFNVPVFSLNHKRVARSADQAGEAERRCWCQISLCVNVISSVVR